MKCDNAFQLCGIRTGTYDYPNPNGGQSCRVAHVNTGAGLRLVIALDRGGDIVEAAFNEWNLAYLTPNDYKPPSHAYHREAEWLTGWPGGLLTTCGPGLMGEPRVEHGQSTPLHGRFSNTPTAVLEVKNPDAELGAEMRLSMLTRDSRMFGPVIEVRRTLRCWLGRPSVQIEDVVTNRGDDRQPHGMLYHINFGYPLLDEGARLVFGGKAAGHCLYEGYSASQLNECKFMPPPSQKFRGTNEGVIVVESSANGDGWARTGLISRDGAIAVEVSYPTASMPRLANWQHFGPRGSYVTALEPFNGSLFGLANDDHPAADVWLDPGKSCTYQLKIHVHRNEAAITSLAGCDRPLIA